jgi:hypothetical protein
LAERGGGDEQSDKDECGEGNHHDATSAQYHETRNSKGCTEVVGTHPDVCHEARASQDRPFEVDLLQRTVEVEFASQSSRYDNGYPTLVMFRVLDRRLTEFMILNRWVCPFGRVDA